MTMYSDSQNQFPRRHYPAQQEDIYAEDTERLYESFNDLYEDFDDGRSKTPFVIIGALLAIAIVGGGLAFAYKSGVQGFSAGSVPVVVADNEPVKVKPEDPGGMDIPYQGSAIFDKITGTKVEDGSSLNQASGQKTEPLTIGDLAAEVTGGNPNQQIALANSPTSNGETLLSPAAPAGNPNEQAVLPSQAGLPKPLLPPGAEQPAATPSPGQGAPGSPVLSPRKVETFTITPDGKIVSQMVEAPPAPAGGAQTPSAGNSALALPSLPSVLEPIAPATANGVSAQNPSLSQDAGQQLAPSLPGGGTASLVPSPQPKPRPTTRDLAAVQKAKQQPAAPAVSTEPGLAGKYAVQVASNQRQADSLAIFADLKRRYPDLVGNYRPLIQRADLGSRGIFFRLRIGPLASKADANRLCGSLRNAGLPGCIVRSL